MLRSEDSYHNQHLSMIAVLCWGGGLFGSKKTCGNDELIRRWLELSLIQSRGKIALLAYSHPFLVYLDSHCPFFDSHLALRFILPSLSRQVGRAVATVVSVGSHGHPLIRGCIPDPRKLDMVNNQGLFIIRVLYHFGYPYFMFRGCFGGVLSRCFWCLGNSCTCEWSPRWF